MKSTRPLMALIALLALAAGLFVRPAQAQSAVSIAVDLDTAASTGMRIEGLVSDSAGRLYTSDLDSRRFFRYNPSSNTLETLGTLPRTASGMAFDASGNLYMASGDTILMVSAAALQGTSIAATDVMTFATGVPGANGLAFGPTGALYVSGGNTGNIYTVASSGMTSTFASGLTSEREEQRISTNGLAFWTDGTLYNANTGTGSIDRITLNADGTLGQVQQWVKDPLLLGADGITFASNGDLYVAANERNAIVRVTTAGVVEEVAVNGNEGPLEFPASPAFSGNALYASNFDIERGANAPNAGGIGASLARIDVGVSGLPLPVTSGQPVATVSAAVPTTTAGASAVPSTPESTVAVSTPQSTVAVNTPAPIATAQSTAVAPAIPTITMMPAMPTMQATSTGVLPGMPTTGGNQGDYSFMLALLLLCSAAVATGLLLRRAENER